MDLDSSWTMNHVNHGTMQPMSSILSRCFTSKQWWLHGSAAPWKWKIGSWSRNWWKGDSRGRSRERLLLRPLPRCALPSMTSQPADLPTPMLINCLNASRPAPLVKPAPICFAASEEMQSRAAIQQSLWARLHWWEGRFTKLNSQCCSNST